MSRFGVGSVSPLWEAGFIGNPFRALSDDEWEEVALVPAVVRSVLEWDDTIHLQILGAAGHGKSSVLRAMVREARQHRRIAAYEYIPNGADVFLAEIDEGSWFCLDEVQRLSERERQRLIRLCTERKPRLFLGSHEDLTPLFERAGLSLTTVMLDTLDDGHFNTVLENRLSYFSRSGMPHATFAPDALSFLRERFGSDLRHTERFLYDYFQLSVRSTVPITAKELRQESRLSP